MDYTVQRSLNDKLYERRKIGALELERLIRECLDEGDHNRIHQIIEQLRHEYAYAVHQPHARNGGLIGLAAASIALGPDVAHYLGDIIPPVLACFSDQDARVRYYACESMYNIAKVAKGEILPYFNEIFDALCKLSADSELSVKNGAELLDRLIKDIVAESAATFVSILQQDESDHTGRVSKREREHDDFATEDEEGDAGRREEGRRNQHELDHEPEDEAEDEEDVQSQGSDLYPTAFSIRKFIPLLQERIYVINPFTRMFLVAWITLLDSIPDLELVSYLPEFLPGLFQFLSDGNPDVQVATQNALELFLQEIKRIARVKRGVIASRGGHRHSRALSDSGSGVTEDIWRNGQEGDSTIGDGDNVPDGIYFPGQDVHVDHERIIEILLPFLENQEESIQLGAMWWIENFFEICPDELLVFVPRLISTVLPAIANENENVRIAALKLNSTLLNFIVSLPDDPQPIVQPPSLTTRTKEQSDRRESIKNRDPRQDASPAPPDTPSTPVPPIPVETGPELDYPACVGVLTLQFLNEHEETRIAAMEWLILLHRKAPKKILLMNDGTFPALLKTLTDPSDEVVQRDLQLLSQISHHSDDEYVNSFLVNLLSLFSTDRQLLEKRGNQIIRQLCVDLNPERIYRTLAEILEKDEDVEFASIMVQNLNNNLITAPELADLRKRLRNLEMRDGQAFFVAMFRAWCHNAVATFSLCLLAQAYEQAYNLLHIFADLDITVNLLIQIDKLVQLLESPVFTYLRLQLLEPEKYPHLYKCLYGLLMLLPQSAAFGALRNRLSSVSAIGYLHVVPRGQVNTYERSTRIKTRSEEIKWTDLLDKFRSVQDKARRQAMQRSSASSKSPASTSRPTSIIGVYASGSNNGSGNVGSGTGANGGAQSGGGGVGRVSTGGGVKQGRGGALGIGNRLANGARRTIGGAAGGAGRNGRG
ncbi:ARM repeat-containing protein [Ascobolus immersus RN42]|uniref:ARM repeat-containing protein n=1 Tax=Ascobolus immersus RN42 TaxID=1160509 RepID=A0A3N4I5R3_ASCIM|nr:ARM repeat-containing protein [Ascobolus immersus RN42]